MSRKGRAAAPATSAAKLKMWGRCAPLSRHNAAPTGIATATAAPAIQVAGRISRIKPSRL
ncbi:hypothetical protein HV87_26555 [Pseudomonas aeruginosa]|nr:hypothetical protein HV87_26555 [Pseudomonas aeruginosa]